LSLKSDVQSVDKYAASWPNLLLMSAEPFSGNVIAVIPAMEQNRASWSEAHKLKMNRELSYDFLRN